MAACLAVVPVASGALQAIVEHGCVPGSGASGEWSVASMVVCLAVVPVGCRLELPANARQAK